MVTVDDVEAVRRAALDCTGLVRCLWIPAKFHVEPPPGVIDPGPYGVVRSATKLCDSIRRLEELLRGPVDAILNEANGNDDRHYDDRIKRSYAETGRSFADIALTVATKFRDALPPDGWRVRIEKPAKSRRKRVGEKPERPGAVEFVDPANLDWEAVLADWPGVAKRIQELPEWDIDDLEVKIDAEADRAKRLVSPKCDANGAPKGENGANNANTSRLFPGGVPARADVVDLVARLDAELPKMKKSARQIAREFSPRNWESLLTTIRRLRRAGKVNLPDFEECEQKRERANT